LCPATRRDTLETKPQPPIVVSDKGAEALTEKKFASICRQVLTDSQLRNRSTRLLYLLMLMECGDCPTCSLTIKHLMGRSGLCRRSIQIHLRSLEARGLVISTQKTDENGRSEANEYFLPKLKDAIDEAVANKNRKSSPGTRKGSVAS
jgi:hypothetical protein